MGAGGWDNTGSGGAGTDVPGVPSQASRVVPFSDRSDKPRGQDCGGAFVFRHMTVLQWWAVPVGVGAIRNPHYYCQILRNHGGFYEAHTREISRIEGCLE
jgi:hypothetical protein